jgi:hypothetical protein
MAVLRCSRLSLVCTSSLGPQTSQENGNRVDRNVEEGPRVESPNTPMQNSTTHEASSEIMPAYLRRCGMRRLEEDDTKSLGWR